MIEKSTVDLFELLWEQISNVTRSKKPVAASQVILLSTTFDQIASKWDLNLGSLEATEELG